MATTSAISTLPNISISSILSTIDNRRSTIYDLLSTSKYQLSTIPTIYYTTHMLDNRSKAYQHTHALLCLLLMLR